VADRLSWRTRPPLARIAAPVAGPGSAAAGVVARPLAVLGLATVLARKGARDAVRARVAVLHGVTPPDGPARAAAGDVAFVATGPGAWLAVDESGRAGWAAGLAGELEGLASVSDQSDGYVAVRLEGPAVRDVLVKGVFLDLHPQAFPVDAVAATTLAHMGVILWRRHEEAFDLLAFRSYAGSLWHWLAESTAEYGLAVASAAQP